MNRETKAAVAASTAALLLGAGCLTTGLLYTQERAANRDLQAQLDELSQKEKRAAVLQSISAQMEDIAYQQKAISDEQREEAVQQTRVANEMRHRSEQERQNALAAEAQAVAAQRSAQEAQSTAEQQRHVAEQQRAQAEQAKRVADTLSYIALGRSLASLASTQYQAGKTDVADLLAYAAHRFTTRYGGDMFNPAVFRALSDASQSVKTTPMLNGAVTALISLPGDRQAFVGVSNFGEMLLTHSNNGKQENNMLISDKSYDFRDVSVADDGTIVAVSRTGHLAVSNGVTTTVVPIPGIVRPMGVLRLSGTELLVVGESQLALFDVTSSTVTHSRTLPFRVIAIGRCGTTPVLFDQTQGMHTVSAIDNISRRNVPVSGTVTAYACSDDDEYEAYGMTDGTIFLTDRQGKRRTLVGHLSRISRLRFIGQRLYSSAYDGALYLWPVTEEKIEPMPVFTTRAWIQDFIFSQAKHAVVAGDYHGEYTQTLIDVPSMVDAIKTKLRRNLTVEEWNYYIGPNVPYEQFVEQ